MNMDPVRHKQATLALKWLRKHPWATSVEIAKGVPEIGTTGMWAAVRPYAFEVAGALYKGQALANTRCGRKSVWKVTKETDALSYHALNRFRHATARDLTLAKWDGTGILAQSGTPMYALLAGTISGRGAAAQAQRSTLDALDAMVAAEREAVRSKIQMVREKWVA